VELELWRLLGTHPRNFCAQQHENLRAKGMEEELMTINIEK
jgi:hypothetical protein